MIEKVKARLKALGYECGEADDVSLTFGIQKTEQHIKHVCNINDVPACLEHALIDMVCGDFLITKKTLGQLTSFQIEPIVKRLTEGDTTVEYSSTTDREATFNAYMDKLVNGHTADLIAHRKLRW